ncbi:ArsR/SmtB family transcription factor [Thermococcus zilligii]|uniref:ArsR/SmtB family transcription factor n=1 Tax=Thermococcus zilligii TaxID=54076 RepID=UPI00029B43C1|nr:helix-turn-helix domain-containing protein [Thermococcus zilligii]
MDVEELAKLFDGLAHPLRLGIVALLSRERRPIYLNEIAKELGISRGLAKIHLRKLEKAGIVKSRLVIDEEKGKALRFYELIPFSVFVSPESLGRWLYGD